MDTGNTHIEGSVPSTPAVGWFTCAASTSRWPGPENEDPYDVSDDRLYVAI